MRPYWTNCFYWRQELARWRTWEMAAIRDRHDFAREMVRAIHKQVKASRP